MTGFVIAMKNEAETLISNMGGISLQTALGRKLYTGNFCGEKCVVIVCGIGKVNAAICTQYLIDNFAPKRLVNFGLAGGLGSDINIGDIVFAKNAVQYDFDLSLINNCAVGRLEEFESEYFDLTVPNAVSLPLKTLATGDRFNENKIDEELIYKTLNARLRDMEGGAVAHCAAMNNVPLYIFKAISDKVEKDSVKSYFENSRFALTCLEARLEAIFKEILTDEKN